MASTPKPRRASALGFEFAEALVQPLVFLGQLFGTCNGLLGTFGSPRQHQTELPDRHPRLSPCPRVSFAELLEIDLNPSHG